MPPYHTSPPSHRWKRLSETGFVSYDLVTRRTVDWASVRRITAAMGRQQYDMTICLTLDHRGGGTIFLPETHPDRDNFPRFAGRHLPAMLPPERWMAMLNADIGAVIRVYPA